MDDDPLTCERICEILRSAGMDASFLTSSTEAAERLKREKYHAVFLDMRMPAPDGSELARQVRASRVNASTVIVMVTGEQDRTVMGRAFEAGVEFFLFKPVERNKLLKLWGEPLSWHSFFGHGNTRTLRLGLASHRMTSVSFG